MGEDNPILVAIILCEMMIVDEATKKRSLIGMFNQITVNALPVNYPQMILFFSFTNWKGRKRITVRVADPQGNIASEADIEHTHPNPVGVLEFTLQIDDFILCHTGIYEISVLVDGTPMGARQFHVAKEALVPMVQVRKR